MGYFAIKAAIVVLTNALLFCQTDVGENGLVSSHDVLGGNRDWSCVSKDESYMKIANIDGPGYITRIWFTGFEPENWRISVDGKINNVRSKTLERYFAPYACKTSLAHHCYIPIKFKKNCKFYVNTKCDDENTRFYYQINYKKTTNIFVAPKKYERFKYAQDVGPKEDKTLYVSSDTGGTLVDLEIVGLENYERSYLSGIKLYVKFDDIESFSHTLGTFFCQDINSSDIISLPIISSNGYFRCRFPMPFKNKIEVGLYNPTKAKFNIKLEVIKTPLANKYFKTFYSKSNILKDTITGKPNPKHLVISANGKGSYVGCNMKVKSYKNWLGLEGDDIVEVDGIVLCGTGIEDYFNGGWYYDNLYSLPFCGLVERDEVEHYTYQYRYLLLDALGFTNSLNMYFENYMSDIESLAFWYKNW
jgi:hypothetical protein